MEKKDVSSYPIQIVVSTSELRLRGVAFWCGGRLAAAWRIPIWAYPRHLAHFFHLLPLFLGEDHHIFRHKGVFLHCPANYHVVAGLNVRHLDALSSAAQ